MSKRDAEAKEEDGGAEAEPVPLKQGDYVVQVYLIEARDLKGRGPGGMSDPVVTVECMGKKQHSSVHKNALNPVFEQMLVFEYKNLEPGEVEAGHIDIGVFDANTFRRNDLIGSFAFDVASVYYRKHHELFRQWIALTDVTDKHEGIQGYLKLSITVLGPGDEQYMHPPEDNDDEDDGQMAVMMPPRVEQKGRLMRVKVYRVEDLPAMDEAIFGGAKCDPYARVEFAGIDIKTNRGVGQTADLLEELQVPVMEPVMSSAVRFSVYDWDAAGSDDRIQSFNLDYNKIAKDGLQLTWFNLYGAPADVNNKVAEQMNRGYVEGSMFRGRVLVAATVEDSKEPKKDVAKLLPLRASELPPTDDYVVQCDLYEGSEICDKGKMHVEVSFGNNYWRSQEVEVEDGRCRWYEEMKGGEKDWPTAAFPKTIEQVPDVFVYLCVKKKRLSFKRFNFKALLERGWKVPPAWHILREDRSIDAFSEGDGEFPGTLLFSLRVGRRAEMPYVVPPESRPLNQEDFYEDPANLEYFLDEKSDLPAPPSARVFNYSVFGTLTVEVLEGRELPTFKSKLTVDSFVKLKMGKTKFRTKTMPKTLFPKWNEKFSFTNVNIATPLTVHVKDEGRLGDEDLGMAEIDLRNQMTRANAAGPGCNWTGEDWVLFNDKFPNSAIRLKFDFKFVPVAESQSLQRLEEAALKESSFLSFFKKKKKRQIRGELGVPEQAQYQLRLHLYQARQLVAADASGLSDPYVIVRLCGKKVKSAVKPETLNPAWYQTYHVNVELPIPLSLAPDIQLYVYDFDKFSGDDPLGRMHMAVSKVFKMNQSVEHLDPQWFQLYDWEDKPIDGCKILLSFQLLTPAQAAQPIPNIAPPTLPMHLEVATLGCRSLTSMLGVHKTYIEFEMPNGKRFKTNMSKDPNANNPNFLQILKIPVDLPRARLYAPSVDIEVRDVLFGGLVKRVIGTASLQLAEYMKDHFPDEKSIIDRREVIDQRQLEEEEQAEARQRKLLEELGQRQANVHVMTRFHRMYDNGWRPPRPEKKQKKEEEGVGAGLKSMATKFTSFFKRGDKDKADKDKGEKEKDKAKDEGSNLLEMKERTSSEIDDTGLGDIPEAPRGGHDATDMGLGDLPEIDEKSPLVATQAAVSPEDKFDPEEKLPFAFAETEAGSDDEEEDIPKYLRGRHIVDNELEDVIHMAPFDAIDLYTGQKNAGPLGQKYKQVGKFKGLVRLLKNKDEPPKFDQSEFLKPKDVFVRLYVLRGVKLMPKDDDGGSDPYLVVKLGKKKFSTRDNHLNNTLEPDFYDSFEFPAKIPGDADLRIEVWDWDGIGDDLIGFTVIDVEDRWFSPTWRGLKRKPLEWRTLRSPTSSVSQGKILCFVEVLEPAEARRDPLMNIKPPPPELYELRVIIWGVRDTACKDLSSKMNDLYVTAQPSVQSLKEQRTDIHLRAKKGKGNFNWRMKFPIELPCKPRGTWPRLKMQIWDMDIIGANDAIAEANFSLKWICKQAMKKKDVVKMLDGNKDRLWLDHMTHPNEPPDVSQGRLEFSLEMMPMTIAAQVPAGFGRSDPNMNPFLPEPEGRLRLSLFHPCDMIRDIIGDENFYKLCCFCCMLACGAACFFMAPMILSNIVTNLLTPKF